MDSKVKQEIQIQNLKEDMDELKSDRNKAKFAFLGTFLTLMSSIFYATFIK